MGVAQVDLDGLDLCSMAIGWYKLFSSSSLIAAQVTSSGANVRAGVSAGVGVTHAPRGMSGVGVGGSSGGSGGGFGTSAGDRSGVSGDNIRSGGVGCSFGGGSSGVSNGARNELILTTFQDQLE